MINSVNNHLANLYEAIELNKPKPAPASRGFVSSSEPYLKKGNYANRYMNSDNPNTSNNNQRGRFDSYRSYQQCNDDTGNSFRSNQYQGQNNDNYYPQAQNNFGRNRDMSNRRDNRGNNEVFRPGKQQFNDNNQRGQRNN